MLILTIPRRYFCCGSLLLLGLAVLAVGNYTLVFKKIALRLVQTEGGRDAAGVRYAESFTSCGRQICSHRIGVTCDNVFQ